MHRRLIDFAYLDDVRASLSKNHNLGIATRPGRGLFDETNGIRQRLASVVVSSGEVAALFFFA